MTTTETLKLALEALEPDWELAEWYVDELREKAITALREALAEQPAQQEPVALDVELNEAACELLNVFTAKQPPDFDEYTQIRLQLGNGHSGHGLYVSLAEYPEEGSTLLVNTTPPQRTWVNATTWRGLTAEERNTICENAGTWREAMKVIEAKLKEKNCG